jgi:hypothetical protein
MKKLYLSLLCLTCVGNSIYTMDNEEMVEMDDDNDGVVADYLELDVNEVAERMRDAELDKHNSFIMQFKKLQDNVELQKTKYVNLQYEAALQNAPEYFKFKEQHDLEKMKRELAQWKKQEAQENPSWTDRAGTVGSIVGGGLLDLGVGVVKQTAGQLAYTVVHTKIANSKYRNWIKTEHEIKTEKLKEEADELGLKANKFSINAAEIKQYNETKKQRLLDQQDAMLALDVITKVIDDIEKEKNETSENEKKTTDAIKKARFKKQCEEYDADVEILQEQIRDRRKNLIKQIKNDNYLTQIEHAEVRPSDTPRFEGC